MSVEAKIVLVDPVRYEIPIITSMSAERDNHLQRIDIKVNKAKFQIRFVDETEDTVTVRIESKEG